MTMSDRDISDFVPDSHSKTYKLGSKRGENMYNMTDSLQATILRDSLKKPVRVKGISLEARKRHII